MASASTPSTPSGENAEYALQQPTSVAFSVSHPRLTKANPKSIRVFLSQYDQYVKEVTARALQLAVIDSTTTEPVRPVNLSYCVDSEWLTSCIELEYITGVNEEKDITDTKLRTYLESEAEEEKDTTTAADIEAIIRKELAMDMTDSSSRSRMKGLFTSYVSLLRCNGLSWVMKDHPKLAVKHLVSAVRPKSLQQRLETDLELVYAPLKKDVKSFMKHAMTVAEAFQVIDNGPPTRSQGSKPRNGHSGSNDSGSGTNARPAFASEGKSAAQRGKRPPPFCLHPPCKKDGKRHWIDDCTESTNAEKEALKAEIFARKAADGPSRSTRSQKARSNTSNAGTIGRLKPHHANSPASCSITVSDGTTTVESTGRCDDGADDSIVSSKLAESAVLKGIGKLTAIRKVTLAVALKKGTQNTPEHFSFSRTWTVPQTILHLASGNLALKNISFLVADDDLACENLLIGRPVLQHLRVDTHTLLDNNRFALQGSDCAEVGNPTMTAESGFVSRLMIERLNGIKPQATKDQITAERPRVNYDVVRRSEDPFPDPALLDPVDSDQHETIRIAVNDMVQGAIANGLPEKNSSELKKVVQDHVDIFRTSLSSGPPAQVSPLKIALTPNARPIRVRLRKYSQDQRNFLDKFVSDLVRAGMAYPNPSAAWASAPLIVPKPGPARFRFTVDLRPINQFTVKHQYPMPNVEQELLKLSKSRFFATFDLSHGYWQFPLDAESQELQSFITPDGVFSPTRVLHGTTNATTHLQAVLVQIFPRTLRNQLLYWLDDILLHHATVDGLLDAIRLLFRTCARYSIRLHPEKCILFAQSIRWCGKIVSAEGVRHDPRNLDGLLKMEVPTTGAHLQQFVCAMQWVKTAIPDFANLISPLHELLERVYDTAGKRTKRAVAVVQLESLEWGTTEVQVFNRCKEALSNLVTLAHRDERKRLCLYTDASDTNWSGIVTQVPYEDRANSHEGQRHSPPAFCSGRFNATQLGWSTLEKEAFAIMATVERMHWLVATSAGFDLFTDHNNLIFLFDPLSIIPDLSQSSTRKVLRWAVRLSSYSYTCFHISGEDNVWADMLTRWSAPRIVRRLVKVPILPSSDSDSFCWPSAEEIVKQQEFKLTEKPENVHLDDRIWKTAKGAIWIPESSDDLQLRLCIIAHTGPAGHRGTDITRKILSQNYFWKTLAKDVHTFVQACIHCISTLGGDKVPRPFGPALHGTKPNDLLQFDYIEIGPSYAGPKYILMLRDDHSDYKWFFATPGTTADNAALAIIDWCAAFNVPQGLMSDGPTHFPNETVRMVSRGLRVPHHFTLPYTPWSNGAVERLGKEVLRTFRALTSELQMDFKEWTDLVPIIQSALNNAPSPHRNNIAPITAFTGMTPTPPISTFLRSTNKKSLTVTEAQLERCVNIKALQNRMGELHPVVQNSLQHNRERSRTRVSRGTLPNFETGDFVLVAREDFNAGEKLALRWRGPRRVVKAVSDYVYQVEDLRNGAVEEVHGTRLKFYHDSSLNKEAIMSHVLSSETGMQVSRLLKIIEDENGLFIRVRWKGLGETGDTLEPIQQMYKDVPGLLLKLLRRKNTPPELAAKARETLGL